MTYADLLRRDSDDPPGSYRITRAQRQLAVAQLQALRELRDLAGDPPPAAAGGAETLDSPA